MSKFDISCVTVHTRILLILILLTLIQKNVGKDEECKYKSCGNDPHTMCKYPAKLDKTKNTCRGPEAKAGLTKEQRKGLLDTHNVKRQMIAQGKVAGQPKAANMMKMRWNYEMEAIAQRYLNSCPENTGHDNCRKLMDGRAVGQNSAWGPFKYKISPHNKELGEIAVKIWFDEIKDMKPEYVDDITSSDDAFSRIGHYSQLAWATSEELGCGYLAHEYEDAVYQYYTCNCNYAPPGNVFLQGTAIYKRGEPCSQCPAGTWCSKRFPGLCTAERDEYDDLALPANTTEGTKRKKRKHRHSDGDSLNTRFPHANLLVPIVGFLKYFYLN